MLENVLVLSFAIVDEGSADVDERLHHDQRGIPALLLEQGQERVLEVKEDRCYRQCSGLHRLYRFDRLHPSFTASASVV
jgi:hypothetical protein